MKPIIIGAGAAGLSAAKTLQSKGIESLILEKSSRPGGRMASKSFEGACFDYGAQFYTVHGLYMQDINYDWLERGLAERWCRGFLNGDKILNPDGYMRFKGHAGMNALLADFAEGLTVQTGVKIIKIEQGQESFILEAESGQKFESDTVILTSPLPQARALLKKASNLTWEEDLDEKLNTIKYNPSLALMVLIKEPSGLAEPGALSSTDPMSPIAWICDNQQKGISEQPCLTVLATPHFSRQNYKADREETAQKLLTALSEKLKVEVVDYQLHRWRYARPKRFWSTSYLALHQEPYFLLAGDAFGSAQHNLEGAFESGRHAARAVIKARF